MYKEEWKTIPGFPPEYEVSSLGNIRRLGGTYNTTFYGKPMTRKKPARQYALVKKSPKGYQRINLCKRVYFVHRLVALAFIDNHRCLPQINHKNGCKTDNRVENLEWVTNRQNRTHAVMTGLHASGPKPAARKYDDAAAREMRSMDAKGVSLRAIGREFGTSHGAIRKVLTRQR